MMHKDNSLIRTRTSSAGFMGMVIVLSACGPPRVVATGPWDTPSDSTAKSDPKCRHLEADRSFCINDAENARLQCLSEYEVRYGYRLSPYFHECYEPYRQAINNSSLTLDSCY